MKSTRGLRRLVALIGTACVAIVLLLSTAPPSGAADQTRLELINKGSGLRADVMWGSTATNTGVFLWPDNASASQEFNLLDSGGGWFRLQARHSSQCLMVDWRPAQGNGTPVIQNPYCSTGYPRNEWREIRTGCLPGPLFCVQRTMLQNRATGKCLDAQNGAAAAPRQQAVLQQWDCITDPAAWNWRNQDWSLSSVVPPVVH